MTLCNVCSAQQRWLLQKSDGSWRQFSKESNWRKAAQNQRPLETAVVNKTTSNTNVVYDVQGESGDWRNIDRYTFLPNGTLLRLKRKFASVSQDLLLIQVFELDTNRKFKKSFESEESLNTGKPKKVAPENPPMPIATDIKQLGFMKVFKNVPAQ